MDVREDLEIIASDVRSALEKGRRLSLKLASGGRLYIDRPLPFLCVYRPPVGEILGDDQLITTQASFLIAPHGENGSEIGRSLCRVVLETLSPVFEEFLVVEIWTAPPSEASSDGGPANGFRIFRGPGNGQRIAGHFARTLGAMGSGQARVEVFPPEGIAPPGMEPLLSDGECAADDCTLLGLECAAPYKESSTGEFYAVVHRRFRRDLAAALQEAFFAFASGVLANEASPHVLASTRLQRIAGSVDQRIARVASSFDFLLYVTPVNIDEAWEEFRSAKFDQEPQFTYRPLPFDPRLLKRTLYDIPLERVEDPILWQLFAEKQDELDRQITLLAHRGSPEFRYGSVALYGPVEDRTRMLADKVQSLLGARPRAFEGECLDAEQLAERARAEIAYYRSIAPGFEARVEITDAIAAGLMVSRDRLLISSRASFPEESVDALLHHEVGTHLLTWFNAGTQPLQQLSYGLAGCEASQEGLAVFAEYLSGGLRPGRLGLLATRVKAVCWLMEGASFVEAFRRLARAYSPKSAFRIAVRVYRSGGLTKDAVYLKGLDEVVTHLGKTGEIEPLFAGKVAVRNLPALSALSQRGIVRAPELLPRYVHETSAEKLSAAQEELYSILETPT